jgi:hypothetical protein
MDELEGGWGEMGEVGGMLAEDGEGGGVAGEGEGESGRA